MTPPAGRPVARNVLDRLVTAWPYSGNVPVCQPRGWPARFARPTRRVPYFGGRPRCPGRRAGGRSHRWAWLRKRLTTVAPTWRVA
jgi:hypothetical protein